MNGIRPDAHSISATLGTGLTSLFAKKTPALASTRVGRIGSTCTGVADVGYCEGVSRTMHGGASCTKAVFLSSACTSTCFEGKDLTFPPCNVLTDDVRRRFVRVCRESIRNGGMSASGRGESANVVRFRLTFCRNVVECVRTKCS